jgi:hypothetical protein
VSGARYQLHFALAGNFFGAPVVKTLEAGFGGLTASKSFDTSHSTGGAPGWVCPTIDVRATGTSTPLSFTSTTDNAGGPNFYGPVVDDVRVVAPNLVTVTKPLRPTIGQGARKFMVAVKGTNFEPGYTVSLSNPRLTLGATTFVDEHTLEVPVTVPVGEPAGQAFDVTVTGGVVGESDTCGKSLSVSAAPDPNSASPATTNPGVTHATTTVGGHNFQPGAVAALGGGITVEHTTVSSSGLLSITYSVASDARIGDRTITVRNPDGGVGVCRCFIVSAPSA